MALYAFFLVAENGDRIGAEHVTAPSDAAAIALLPQHQSRHPQAKRIEIWDGTTRRVYPSPEIRRR